jgi:HlyD family secretion protein
MNRPVVIAMGCAVVALAGCARNQGDPPMVGTLERDRIEMIAEESEPIVSIEVREGAHVAAGQVLLRQETQVAQARAAELQAQVAQAKQKLTELERGERVEVVRQARARVESAKAMVARDDREYKRVSALVQQRLVSQTELDQRRAADDSSQANLREAQEQLNALLHGNRIEEIDQARAALAAAQSTAQQTEITDARLIVRASRPGVVEAIPYKMGERPPKGSPVIVMLADTPAFARIYVPAEQRIRIRPGTKTEIYIEGQKTPVPGFFRYVASDSVFTPYYALTQRDRSRLVFLAEVEVSNDQARNLPAGMPVEVRLVGDGRD